MYKISISIKHRRIESYILDLISIIVSTNMLSVFLMDIYTVPIKRVVFRKNVNSF